MKMELEDIPGLEIDKPKWEVKTLNIIGCGNLTLNKLEEWAESKEMQDECDQMMSNIMITAQSDKVIEDTPYVKKSANDAHDEIYEFRAKNPVTGKVGKARIMFFYDEDNGSIIICTNTFVKGAGDQNMAFDHCAQLKAAYLNQK